MLTIPPEIIRINNLLKEHFGMADDRRPIWRIVWSDDQFEKRLMDVTDSGIHLLFPEVREVPRYNYIPHKYVLEQLVAVPFVNQHELPEVKVSYEPLWVFEDKYGNPLPPKFEACKLVIDTIHAAKQMGSLKKYTDPEADGNNGLEAKAVRLAEIHGELFGNDTAVTDALHSKTGVVNPYSSIKES